MPDNPAVRMELPAQLRFDEDVARNIRDRASRSNRTVPLQLEHLIRLGIEYEDICNAIASRLRPIDRSATEQRRPAPVPSELLESQRPEANLGPKLEPRQKKLLYRYRECAELLSVSLGTVNLLAKHGYLKTRGHGANKRVTLKSLEALAEKGVPSGLHPDRPLPEEREGYVKPARGKHVSSSHEPPDD